MNADYHLKIHMFQVYVLKGCCSKVIGPIGSHGEYVPRELGP